MDWESGAITTVLVHTPLRPTGCALRALQSLRKATKRSHVVEFVVQGPMRKDVKLPDPKEFKDDFKLKYYMEPINTGVPTRLAESVERRRTPFWAKLDDDARLPSGAWDILIKCMMYECELGNKIGAAQMAPQPGPTLLLHPDYQKKMLRVQRRAHAVRNFSWAKWHLVDVVGSGSSVFNGEVFEKGCQFVRDYKTGGSDIEIGWQMVQKNYKSILCVKPLSVHEHERCSSQKYQSVRMNKKEFKKSARIFFKRWGLEYELLRM